MRWPIASIRRRVRGRMKLLTSGLRWLDGVVVRSCFHSVRTLIFVLGEEGGGGGGGGDGGDGVVGEDELGC
ncbi:hypothetical protein K432DRAFT_21664 [Lepidopterella palustris CBS 459.81]|uniref:Uncharacterized protein n=1 Tax=Lepidopterella palustris CBS 459.81 TaxID=1314670 RepID=A0A8E2EC79_9PEZI|nr:hypothetical protein K432DRAFT_21664 [Lepidopterella palustris CBS 459.81]